MTRRWCSEDIRLDATINGVAIAVVINPIPMIVPTQKTAR